MPAIACFSPVPAPVLEQWLVSQSGLTNLRVIEAAASGGADWDEALATAEVALGDYTFRQAVDDSLLTRMPALRFLQQPSVGYQHIDLEACRRHGVQVANTPGVNSGAVAEHTVMVALALLRRLALANQWTHEGRWSQRELIWEHGMFELAGKTFGIVGLGSVGREVARRLAAFDVSMLYFDAVRATPEVEGALKIAYKPLDHLLRLADIVSLHVPLSEQTRGLIGQRELALLKPNAILINVARGECVDEQALAASLREKRIAAAAVDVFSEEPPARTCPLLGLENALLTPHVAGATHEVRLRVVQDAVDNLARFLKRQPPRNLVSASSGIDGKRVQ